MASKLSNIEVAAAEYGCQVDELIKFRPGDEEGSFVIIAPNGGKFTYTEKVLEARRKKMENALKPKPKPKAKRTPVKEKPLTLGSTSNRGSALAQAKPKPALKPSALTPDDERKN
jgi:hypothetical protein